jgi:hypothetical protein
MKRIQLKHCRKAGGGAFCIEAPAAKQLSLVKENGMVVRVIYIDKSCGMIKAHLLDDLIARGIISAFHGANGWVGVKNGKKIVEGVPEGSKPRNRPGRRKSAEKNSSGYAGED